MAHGGVGPRPRTTKASRRIATALALAAAALVVSASPAAAHADYVGSSPGNGESVVESPDELVIDLSESVELSATQVTLLDDTGAVIPVGRVSLRSDDPSDRESPTSLAVPLPELPDGSYRVQWSTLSSDDLHITEGAIVFAVGAGAVAPDAVSAGSAPPGPAETALRWLAALGLALLVGGSLTDDRMNGTTSPRWPSVRRRLRWTIVAGGALVVAVEFLRSARALVAGADLMTGGWFAAPLLPRWADLLGTTVVLGLATAAAVVRERRGGADLPRTWAGLGYLATVAGMVLVARHGHASADGAGAIAVSAGHLVATAAWLGVTVAAGLVVVAAVRDQDRLLAGRALRRMTPVAVAAAVAAAVTGLVLAGVLVPSVGALGGSGYGRAILTKVVLVAVAGALGLASAVMLRRRGAALRALVLTELGVLAAAALVGGLMASSSPPSQPQWRPTADIPPTTGSLSYDVDDLVVTVTVSPNRPGDNFITVGAYQTRTPSPGRVEGVVVQVAGQPAVPAVSQPDNLWVAPTPRALQSGTVDLEVTIDRAGMLPTTLSATWQVAPAAGAEQGGAALAPLIWLVLSAAAVVTLLALLAWAGWRRARRRAPTTTQVEPGQDDPLRLPEPSSRQ